jgi:glycosyltransferase involved in cell wall biosynthesis
VKLSIIICTRNRSHAIIPCLDSVARSVANAATLDAEIIIVDNCSTDDTSNVVRGWAAKCPFPVNLQFEPQKGLAKARNCGIRAASGALLIWTDDDCRLAPDYVANALKHDAAECRVGRRIGLSDINPHSARRGALA